MGRAVNLWKIGESETIVVYRYGDALESAGLLEVDKTSGVVSISTPVAGMSAAESWFFFGQLAKVKAEQISREGRYPEESWGAT
jgi:hypothetical protein